MNVLKDSDTNVPISGLDVAGNFPDLPDYYEAPLCEAIDKVRQARDEDAVQIIYYTDPHHKVGGNQLRVAAAIRHLAKAISPDCIVVGGDISENSVKPEFLQAQREMMEALQVPDCPVLPIKGNHDDNSIHDFNRKQTGANHVVFPIETYNELYQNLQGMVSFDKGNETGLYYYYDLPSKKTRVVILNSIDIDYKVMDNGMLKQNGQWEYAFSERQVEWVENKAFHFSEVADGENWKVVLFTHIPILQSGVQGYSDGEVERGQKLWKVIKKNRKHVVACFFGHVHIDQVYAIDEIPMISTLNSVSYRNYPESPLKIPGTISEGVVDIISINYAKGELLATRFGAGEDRKLTIGSNAEINT